MAQAAKSQEPSMEEILASIRRIIAEDDSDKVAQRPGDTSGEEIASEAAAARGAPRNMRDPARERASDSYDSPGAESNANRASTILDLTEATSPAPRAAAFDPSPSRAEPVEDAMDASAGDDSAIDAALKAGQPSTIGDDEPGALVSGATSAAVDSAFNALAQTVLVHNARTLEDLVREMLRPMLKVWLDDNLPGLVERLVRAEIERVSRGR